VSEERKALILYRLEMAKATLEDALVLCREGRSHWSILNRAYYAMFYAVLALLTFVGKAPSKHSGAITLFDEHFVKSGEFPLEMSKWLHRAFDLRQRSDYREMYFPNAAQVAEVLQWAKAFVAQVEAYLSARL
jgi:Uncharacterized conserved protein related to C-terminal domain of eukaryotic chaperone, SACSIN